jgi:general secretion pathway protein A
MYLDYFGLKIKPFQITTDHRFLWLGEKHQEALATLRYGIQDNRGFLLLTGEVGTGKTILINRLISLLDIDTIVATIPDPDVESMDFYNFLADGLKMNQTFNSKGEFLIHLRDFLHQSHAKHKQVLLIIDECQRLSHRLIEDIRVLSNIELQDRKLINIFFVGQPEFNAMLMTPENRALAQRITVRYNIEPLDQPETSAYITYRLRVAGSKKPIFKITALNEIFLFSGGIPRLINIVCDHALLTAFSKNLQQIDATVIRECAEELRIPVQQVRSDAATLRTKQEPIPDDVSGSVSDSNASDSNINEGPAIPMEGQGSQAGPRLTVLWRLSYLVVILLLLAALGVVITQYAGGPEPRRYGDKDLAPQKGRTTLEEEKARLADQLTQTKRAQVKQLPAGAKPSQDQGAVKTAIAEKKPVISYKERIVPEDSFLNSVNNVKNQQNNDKVAVSGAPVNPEAIPGIQSVPPVASRIEPLPLMKEKVIIQFDINSNEIEDGSYVALNRIAVYLAAHPEQKISVRGYTDSSGSAGYNETVSNFRANTVKSYLIGKGASAENISAFSMGAFNPIASNETAAGRKKNRRVEIEFVESQTSGN